MIAARSTALPASRSTPAVPLALEYTVMPPLGAIRIRTGNRG